LKNAAYQNEQRGFFMQKNDLVTVTITDVGVSGEGIGKVDGYTLFVKDAIIGDVVEAKLMKAKKNYGYAKLMNIISPSEYRVDAPECPMARKCGGCQIQNLSYEKQLSFKQVRLIRLLGKYHRVSEIIGMEHPYHYRNKVQAAFGERNGEIISGVYQSSTHNIVRVDSCLIEDQKADEIIVTIRKLLKSFVQIIIFYSVNF
jgi:23S rRNA (uracil1939-C5)-methyltransferase